jgi:hypothetical protein
MTRVSDIEILKKAIIYSKKSEILKIMRVVGVFPRPHVARATWCSDHKTGLATLRRDVLPVCGSEHDLTERIRLSVSILNITCKILRVGFHHIPGLVKLLLGS